MTDALDLDDLLKRVDPDRWLSSRFIGDAQARADVVAVYAFDHELGRAPKVASNPLMGEIRLAWWREVLDEVYEARPVRQHPTAQALAAALGPRPAAVARELTKLFEEVRRASLPELAAHYAAHPDVKGEIVIVIAPPGEAGAPDGAALDTALRWALSDGCGGGGGAGPQCEGDDDAVLQRLRTVLAD